MAEQKPSVTDELLKLADLKEKGILTDEEFTAAKAALLRKLHASAPAEQVDCDECGGSGKCHECGGSREVYKNRFTGTFKECPTCSATGRCTRCRGSGKR